MAQGVCELAARASNPELVDAADELRTQLWDYVSVYEQTMDVNGLELPYHGPMTK